MSVLRRSLLLSALLVVPALRAQIVSQPVLSLDGVKKAIAAAEAEAKKNNWSVSIAVVDPSGNLVGFVRMDDAPGASVAVSQAKARSAGLFRRPTKSFADALAGGRSSILMLPNALATEGGVPVVIDGRVVAAIGVSGVTSEQDAQIAWAGAVAVGGAPAPPPAR